MRIKNWAHGPLVGLVALVFMIAAVFTGAPPGIANVCADTGQQYSETTAIPPALVGEMAFSLTEKTAVVALDTSPQTSVTAVNNNTTATDNTTFKTTVENTVSTVAENHAWNMAWAANMRSTCPTATTVSVLNNMAKNANYTIKETSADTATITAGKTDLGRFWAATTTWAANRSNVPIAMNVNTGYYGRANAPTAVALTDSSFLANPTTACGKAIMGGGGCFGTEAPPVGTTSVVG